MRVNDLKHYIVFDLDNELYYDILAVSKEEAIKKALRHWLLSDPDHFTNNIECRCY